MTISAAGLVSAHGRHVLVHRGPLAGDRLSRSRVTPPAQVLFESGLHHRGKRGRKLKISRVGVQGLLQPIRDRYRCSSHFRNSNALCTSRCKTHLGRRLIQETSGKLRVRTTENRCAPALAHRLHHGLPEGVTLAWYEGDLQREAVYEPGVALALAFGKDGE
jgi:hypothetical protein